MYPQLEHPDITRALQTGYPWDHDWSHELDDLDYLDELDEYVIEADENWEDDI